MWTPISDAGDIQLTPPNYYRATAIITSNVSEATIRAKAASYGLTITSYAESAPSNGSRTVTIEGQATKAASVPWKAPWPLSLLNDSHVVSADVSPTKPTADVPAREPPEPVLSKAPVYAAAGVITAALVGWWVFRRR